MGDLIKWIFSSTVKASENVAVSGLNDTLCFITFGF